MNGRRQFIVAACLIGLVGCDGGEKVDERHAYWTSELSEFFASDRDLSELHAWLREHDVYYAFDEADIVDGKWRVQLEWVLLDGWVCESWLLFLEVTIDQSRRITDYSLEQEGVCL